MAQGGAYGMNAGNNPRIMWHDSCRLPVTVPVGLPVTVILPSVPQNRQDDRGGDAHGHRLYGENRL